MPLSNYFGGKGEKVKKKMDKEYGKKKGKAVFYATANKAKNHDAGPSTGMKKKMGMK